MAINYDHQRDRITSTSDVLTISTTGALGVPVGNTAQRPTAASGQIRFNTQLQSFEGYNGSGWSSLGGIVDVDQDTKITAESAPGSDEDTLTFTTAGVDRASINNAGLFNVVSQLTVGGNVQFNGTLNTHTIPSGTGTIALTSDLYTDSDVDTHLNQGSAITNQVLSWDGTDYNWITNSGAGIVLSDISVGAEGTAAGDGGITYDNITGVFTYIPPVLSGITGNTDDITEGTTNLYYTDARVEAVSINEVVEDTTPQLGGDLDLNSKDITGTGNINITGNATVSGYLAGPANFVIDPAGVGDNTGKVVIAGDLQVDGTTTTINSTTLDVDDLNITVAKGSASAAAANGAGLTVDGANATLTYTNADDRWNLNKELNVSRVHGNVTGNVTGTVSDISNHDTDALSEGSTNLYFTDTRARSAISGGTGVTYTPSTGVIEIGQDVATTSDVTFNDATFDGEVTIEGDLTVKGTTTSVNSNEVNIGDSIILLNSDETSTPSQNGGIEIERGTSDNVRFVWDEVNDRWSAEIYDTTTSAFISAKLTANEFIGDVTGNITGQVTDISNFTTDDLTEGTTNLYYTDARTLAKINVSSINELSDVDTATTPPTNGQVLVYDGNTTEWVPGTVSGGGGGNSLFQLLNL